MKKTLILFTAVTIALIFFLSSCHKEKASTLPVLSSTEISNISDSTAISGGVISDDGNADIIARGVCWSLIENPTIADSKTSDGIGSEAYTSKLSKLTYASIYHVRAYATNSVGTAYGNDIVFSTNAKLPTLTTDSVSAITFFSAHCGGKIILDGGTITARGICWSTTSTPTIANNKTSEGSGSANFSSVLSDLTFNTTYYVRAYATNSAGTGYGNIVSFNSDIDGLVAYYNFKGNANDESGKGHHGTINGTATYVTDRKGNANGAMDFTNNSSVSATIGRLGSMAISAWVKAPSPTTWYPTIIEYMPVNTNLNKGAFLIHILGNLYPLQDQGKLYYSLYNDKQNIQTRDDAQTPSPIPYDVWNFLTFTYDSATKVAKLYVNNVLITNKTSTNSLYDQNLSLITIGRSLIYNPTKPTNLVGSIDELRIYNRALSSDEINTLFKL